LKEELGLTAEPAFLFCQIIPKVPWSGQKEQELAHVFEISSNAELQTNSEEVAQVKFMAKTD
jgi:isopentenyldiphosphate isomerase